MRKYNRKIFLLLALLTLLIIGLQTPYYSIQNKNNYINRYSNYYLPTYLELNKSLSNPSTSHSACLPVAVADIDGDGTLEILTGTDQGIIYVYRGSNNNYSEVYNVSIRTIDTSIPIGDDKIYSIAVGDINNNPSNIEILVGTVSHITVLHWSGSGFTYNRKIILDLENRIVTSIVIDDLVSDGDAEIIVATGAKTYTGTGLHTGEIYIWHASQFQASPGDWSAQVAKNYNEAKLKAYKSLVAYTAITGDPDNDGQKEIIAYYETSTNTGVVVINAVTYNPEWYSGNQFSYLGRGYGLACGNIDDNSGYELAVGNSNGTVTILRSVSSNNYAIIDTVNVPSSTLVWGLKINDSDNDTRTEMVASTIEGSISVFQWSKLSGKLIAETPAIGIIGSQAGPFNNIALKVDPDEDGYNELIIGKAGPMTGYLETDNVSRLYVYGYAYTSTSLLTPPNPTIISGGDAVFTVQYNQTTPLQGITGVLQIIAVNNDTNEVWPVPPTYFENSTGNYNITLSSDAVAAGNYTVKIILFKPGFTPGVTYINFSITGTPTVISIISGAVNTSGIWETAGDLNPYVNDTTKRITFIYMEAFSGEKILFGDVIAILRDLENNTIEGKERLPWYDLYIIRGGDESYKGVYQVVIDTTYIHAGDYNLYISIQKEGYAAQAVNVLVHVDPIPTTLLVSESNISVFEGEKFTFSAFFYDTFHGRNIVNGNVTYILGEYTGVLAHIGYGLYQASLDTSNMSLSGGVHNIIVSGQGVDYQPSQYSISLTYNIKLNVQLTVARIPETVVAGEKIIVQASLKYLNNDPAVDKQLTFTIIINSVPQYVYSTTNENGVATITVTVPNDASTISITVQFDGDRSTNPHPVIVATTSTGLNHVKVITFTEQVISITPFIGAVAAAALIAAVSYQKLVKEPRRKKKLVEMKKAAEIFKNLTNIQHLIIVEKSSGLVIYERSFAEKPFDTTLLAGFLTAITHFGAELGDKTRRTIRELTYENFIIIFDEKQYVRTALILKDKPTSSLVNKLKEFTERFEAGYSSKLKTWKGNTELFTETFRLVDEVFEFTLTLPHKVTIEAKMAKNLSELQKALIRYAEVLMKKDGYVYLVELVSTTQTLRNESLLEILYEVYNLVKNNYFVPVILD